MQWWVISTVWALKFWFVSDRFCDNLPLRELVSCIFVGREAQDGQNASPCQISRRSVEPLLRYDDFSILPRWRPSAILDLWWAYLDHPRRAFGGLYHCAKFGWNRRSSFHNMHVFRFHQFGWKTPIHAPKIGVLGGFDPLNGEAYQQNPQKVHPWAERRHMTYRSSKSVHRCDLGAWRRDRKEKERKTKTETRQWQTGYSPRPPTSSHRNEILHGGWSSDDSSKFRISSKSVKWFRSCGGSKFAHPLWLGHWLIQTLMYHSFYWCCRMLT